jgi:LemA protein
LPGCPIGTPTCSAGRSAFRGRARTVDRWEAEFVSETFLRGAMDFERDTLTAVMEARAKALTATGPADAAQKEGQLTQALGRLLAVAENYPTLKANDNVKMLQEELSGTENKIGFARQFYNDIATKYNIARETFPSNMIAGSFGFTPAELFEIKDEADRAVPAVDLSIGKK